MEARGYKPHYNISDITSATEGHSLGEMEKVWREIASTEMRINLMNNLIHNKVGFNDIEMFNLGLECNMKSKSLKDEDKTRDITVIEAAMTRKRKDEVRYRREMIKKRNEMRKKMRDKWGEKCNKYRRTIKHLNMTADKTRETLRIKFDKKLKHLKEKYKDDKEKKMDTVPEEMEEFGELAIFSKEKFERLEVQVPTVVRYGDVEIDKDEEEILRMHPKMATVSRLNPGYMELNQEMGYTKLRWQMRKEEEEEMVEPDYKKQKTLEEERRNREKREEKEVEEAKGRQVYNPETGEYDERRWRVTDMPECTRIHLPRPLEVKREAEIEMRRETHARASRLYREKHCDEKGEQVDNLTRQERRGLRSLEKRKNNGEIVITLTDKSSKFCIMKREDYLELGEVHVGKDKEIQREEVVKREKILNSHALNWCRMWETGENHGHGDRVRASKVTRSENKAELYLSYKDHKAEPGKTRPIATGCSSNTLALSNSVSTIVEALANAEEVKREVISTEDMLYNTKEHNKEVKRMRQEHKRRKIRKLRCEKDHPTEIERSGEDDHPTERHPACEEVTCREGEKEEECEARKLAQEIIQEIIQNIRNTQQEPDEKDAGEETLDKEIEILERKLGEKEVKKRMSDECEECGPPAELEDMCLLGLDVVALFPSMSAKKTGEVVRNRLRRSEMKFSGFDWRRGAVYIVMNKHLTGNLAHLWKILPYRRKVGGTQPGMWSQGMMGNQEALEK